ncbi:hypothetical protein HELRODRAFT_84784, partial [Helobdella robusta]|uniref:EF-hand domain-containing protein n=1 Tax=Helobdella robusta TaxID=6412 RepID=T1G5N6_HELRO
CLKFSDILFEDFWSTKDTLNENEDSNIKIKTTLRELVVYILFLIVLCVMTFGMTSGSMFYYNQAINSLFIGSPITDGSLTTFTSMSSTEDLWTFMQNNLLNSLYPDSWYNQMNFTDQEFGFVMHENKLLGVPRIRQVKVRNNSCIIPDDFQEYIRECFDSYNSDNEFKHSFGGINGTAWQYRDSSEMKSSSYSGQISSYGGGGFAQDLALNLEDSQALVQNLFDNLWIDRGTRAVIIDFTLYNGNINLFCVVRLVAELPATGGLFPAYTLQTSKLLRYVTPMDYFVLACEIFFILFLIYYTVEEIIEIRMHKLAYFKSFWNILDVLNILVGVCCCIFDVYRTISVNNELDKLLQNPDKYANFVFLSYCQDMANSALAIMVFFSWIKIFKYISFNKTMTQLSSTLSKCSKDLGGFAVMFFIFFLAFAQLGYLLFGAQVPDYNSLGTCIFTLFRFILGDFDFASLQQANRVLGPIYFVCFVFFMFFILLNMFLAIINDTYSEVKSELAEAKNEFEMGDYFKQGALKMMDKLHLKKEKLEDIESAVKSGDLNNDGVVDFEEWRHNMKKRGYADAEIEAVFARYDSDGNRNLDGAEMDNMAADLERQQVRKRMMMMVMMMMMMMMVTIR